MGPVSVNMPSCLVGLMDRENESGKLRVPRKGGMATKTPTRPRAVARGAACTMSGTGHVVRALLALALVGLVNSIAIPTFFLLQGDSSFLLSRGDSSGSLNAASLGFLKCDLSMPSSQQHMIK